MKELYQSPLRVFIIVTVLCAAGLLAAFNLPISLFPNSSKPTISVSISYGTLNAQEFISLYGQRLENALNAVSTPNLEVEKLSADYARSRVNYRAEFAWGADPKESLREIQSVVNSFTSGFPREIRDSARVNFWSNSSGFVAISFFSPERNLDDLYKLLEPAIVPALSQVQDADGASLWNPSQKELLIELRPEVMAVMGLYPRDIELTLDRGLEGYQGGSLQHGSKVHQIQMPRQLEDLRDIENLLVTTPSGTLVHLSEVAHIDLAEATESNQIFKTNSAKSLILFANPRSGANVKNMAEEITLLVEKAMAKLPKDIEYRLIVDPSEFIRASIQNVIKEVLLAATIASFILFLFIGSLRNTLTAAIEIPLAMVMAFIMMWVFEMNLNLISLGGLALAAGMNVDAAVVVMENIFRYFKDHEGKLDKETRKELVSKAVAEVRLPIIASTLSTLVVFTPLVFTKDLTNAILGDLAKAVIFSHGFSLLIALFVVPTVRLFLMNSERKAFQIPVSPIEDKLVFLEVWYEKTLRKLINWRKRKKTILSLLGLVLIGLSLFAFNKLNRELIGKPDTDWLIVSINTQSNTLVAQMETVAGEAEQVLMDHFEDEIQYTFNQIQRPNNATLMLRLKDKRKMETILAQLEEVFQNTPDVFYWVGPWNPAELPIPDPPDLRLVVRGGSAADRQTLGEDLLRLLRDDEALSRFSSTPGLARNEQIEIIPHRDRWSDLAQLGARFQVYDFLDLFRVATEGKFYRTLPFQDQEFNVKLAFPPNYMQDLEHLKGFPIRVGERIIPLKALAEIDFKAEAPAIYKENGSEMILIEGRQNRNERTGLNRKITKIHQDIRNYLNSNEYAELGLTTKPLVIFEDAQVELNQALKQALLALGISLFLIFLTLLFQFMNLTHTLIILSAVPFAVIGGTLSLYIFSSPLSLNSALGIILLNGIAVNNSIMLVDFIKRLSEQGYLNTEAIVLASRSRLRPILITSLTTILGMLPMALGTGEGGKILQPLGIAVSGGLWFSMSFTLFIVPLLESKFLKSKPTPTKPIVTNLERKASLQLVDVNDADTDNDGLVQ